MQTIDMPPFVINIYLWGLRTISPTGCKILFVVSTPYHTHADDIFQLETSFAFGTEHPFHHTPSPTSTIALTNPSTVPFLVSLFTTHLRKLPLSSTPA